MFKALVIVVVLFQAPFSFSAQTVDELLQQWREKGPIHLVERGCAVALADTDQPQLLAGVKEQFQYVLKQMGAPKSLVAAPDPLPQYYPVSLGQSRRPKPFLSFFSKKDPFSRLEKSPKAQVSSRVTRILDRWDESPAIVQHFVTQKQIQDYLGALLGDHKQAKDPMLPSARVSEKEVILRDEIQKPSDWATFWGVVFLGAGAVDTFFIIDLVQKWGQLPPNQLFLKGAYAVGASLGAFYCLWKFFRLSGHRRIYETQTVNPINFTLPGRIQEILKVLEGERTLDKGKSIVVGVTDTYTRFLYDLVFTHQYPNSDQPYRLSIVVRKLP